jgi:hypothetical protein
MKQKRVQTLSSETTVRQHLIAEKLSGKPLREISREYGSPITHGDIARALKGQFPKSPCKRLALGLPALALHPVCVKCGQVHPPKRCPNQPRRYRDLFDMPADVLREMIVNREEYK